MARDWPNAAAGRNRGRPRQPAYTFYIGVVNAAWEEPTRADVETDLRQQDTGRLIDRVALSTQDI